jgi:hypothetical protein
MTALAVRRGTLGGSWAVRGRFVGGPLAVRGRFVGGHLAVRGRFVGGPLAVRGRFISVDFWFLVSSFGFRVSCFWFLFLVAGFWFRVRGRLIMNNIFCQPLRSTVVVVSSGQQLKKKMFFCRSLSLALSLNHSRSLAPSRLPEANFYPCGIFLPRWSTPAAPDPS